LTGYAIMGGSDVTASQMVANYNAMNKPYPVEPFLSGGAPDINTFCTILYQEALAEDVKPEVVFAQAMHETGWLQFGGDVSVGQYNFAGIGATGGVPGNSFPDVRTGLRAQVQHLKAYASTAPLNQALVDPRFGYVVRGCAPTIELLSGKWAVGSTYGTTLLTYITKLRTY
jgi:hypothetical protein